MVNKPSVLPRLIAGVTLLIAESAYAFQFPHNPQSQAECEAAAEPGRAQARHEHNQGSALNSQSNALSPPAGCFQNERCRTQYYAQKSQMNQRIMEHFRRRDEIQRQVDSGLRACRTAAAANERQREEAKRLADERQREQERQRAEMERQQRESQRQAQERQRDQERQQRDAQRSAADRQREAQRDAAERQRDAQQRQNDFQRQQQAQQSDFMRRQAEQGAAKSEQLRRMQAAELERAQRASGDTARNEPRIIGNLPPSSYAPDTRNQPRPFNAPNTPETHQQTQDQARQLQEQEARILRDIGRQIYVSVRGGMRVAKPGSDPTDPRTVRRLAQGDAARADILNTALNPDGARQADIDERVRAADRANRSINALRGITPAAGQVAGDAYAGIGAQQQRTWQLFDQALTQIDAMGPTSPWTASPAPTSNATPSNAPAPPQASSGAIPPSSISQCLTGPAAEMRACLTKFCSTAAGMRQSDCEAYRSQ